jgi:hypothetical protein
MAASWKVQVLGVHFVEMDVNVMTHLKGIFSLRPAYCMLAETKKRGEDWLDGNAANFNSNQQKEQWTSSWKVQVPSKLKMLLWRLAKQSLPTVETRHRLATK